MSSPGYVDATAGAVEYCESMATEYPDLATTFYLPFADFLKQKLWHQLTLRVLEFVDNPKVIRNNNLEEDSQIYLALYDKVILAVDSKLHPLSLARIASAVALAFARYDTTAAKALLENAIEKQKEQSEVTHLAATIFLQSKHSILALQPFFQESASANDSESDSGTHRMDSSKQQIFTSIKDIIKSNSRKLDDLQMLTEASIVYAAHYEQAMNYYKIVGPPEAFYEQAMCFLNYVDADVSDASSTVSRSTTETDFHQLAIGLCLAALTGQGVYNLAQVEQTPVLQLLLKPSQPSYEWLFRLLQACAAGDVSLFYQLSQTYATEIAAQPALVGRSTAVQEKLTLLALVHLVFEKPSSERVLTFSEISQRLQVTHDQVEWVVMRAISVGLMQATMDQVDQTVHVVWVMPRVLTKPQMQDLANRFGDWATKVSKAKVYMQQQTASFV